MKNSFLLMLAFMMVLILPSKSYGQDNSSPFPKLAVGLSPSSWINVYAGPQASLDFRINKKLNSANEFTYVLGIFDTPGFRVKSGLQFLIKDFKNGCFTLGPNLQYQRVSTDVWFQTSSFSFSDRANQLKIDFVENRVAADALASIRFDLTKRLFLEFGLGAGMHFTTTQVTDATSNNLKTLLTEEPEYAFEEIENSTRWGLLTSFNANFSYVIEK